MLVLSRKPGESIRIGEDIVVEIRRVEGNRVTVAIDAPRHVHILRGELEPYANEFAGAAADAGGDEPYHAEYYRVPRPQRMVRREKQTATV